MWPTRGEPAAAHASQVRRFAPSSALICRGELGQRARKAAFCGRSSLCQGPAGSWRDPAAAGRLCAHRAAGLRQFGAIEIKPGAHQADVGFAPARQLGQPAARHAVRRGGHHRHGSGAREAQGARDGAGRQAHAPVLRAAGGGADPAAVPAVQRLAGCERREPGLQEIPAPGFCRRHAQWPDGAGDPRCRQEGCLRTRACARRSLGEGARRQAQGRGKEGWRLPRLQPGRYRRCLHPDHQCPELPSRVSDHR